MKDDKILLFKDIFTYYTNKNRLKYYNIFVTFIIKNLRFTI